MAVANGGTADGTTFDFPAGAALLRPDGLWILVDKPGPGVVGGAVVLAHRSTATALTLIFNDASAAREAATLCAPFALDITVCTAHELDLRPVLVDEAPIIDRLAPSDAVLDAFAEEFVACGAEPVRTDASLVGEVLGLEVGRVVIDFDNTQARIEVGVGHNDREARIQQGVWFDISLGVAAHTPGTPDDQATRLELVDLERTVEHIASIRVKDAHPQPATLLARAAWLRHSACSDSSALDLDDLRPVRPGAERGLNLDDVAFAIGSRQNMPVLAAFATGTRLDSLPLTASIRDRHVPTTPWLLCLAEGPGTALMVDLAGQLRVPPTVHVLRAPW